MSIMEARGGFPHVWREAVIPPAPATRMHQFPFISKWLTVHAEVAAVRIYFTEEDALAGVNYVEAFDFAGPVEGSRVWLSSTGANSTVELVAYQRRG